MSQIARKQFLTWSVSSLGGLALGSLAGCSADTAETNPTPSGGGAGAGGSLGSAGTSGAGGVTGTAGSTGGGGATGTAGASGGTGGASGGAGGANGGAAGASGGGTGGAGGATGGASGGGAGGASGASGAGGSGGAGANSCTEAMITADISDNHGHELVIPMADIMTGTAKTYDATGTAGHDHWVALTADDFTALKAGMTVRKYSCNGGDHEYVLSCGVADAPAAAPTCNDDCGEQNMLCPDPA